MDNCSHKAATFANRVCTMQNGTRDIRAKFASQCGASFSIALILMLVCVALSAAVLAASTAAAGRFANQGDMDQRYYAVTSAAQLFRDSLGDDDELKLEAIQTKTGTANARTGKITWENEVDISNLTAPAETDRKGYDFLKQITEYALPGFGFGSTKEVSGPNDWATPILSGTQSISFTIEPPSNSDLAKGNTYVGVTARLHDNWTLELDFYNTKTRSGSELVDAGDGNGTMFHLYMRLGASVESAAVQADSATQRKQKTTITWQLQEITPGKGL